MCKHIFTPIAHRGGTEAAFENTFEAFADAYALGYRWFETDVQISKDGFLYAIHDSNLKRIVGINININQLNSEDLDQILISGKYRIPRLDLLLQKFHDVTLDYCKKNGIKVHAWTINERNEMNKLIAIGVDGIMTDNCRTLLDVLRKYKFFDKKIVLHPFLNAQMS